MVNDPEEKHNLTKEKTKVLAQLKEQLKAHIENYSSLSFSPKRKITAEEREKLKSLGYAALAEEVPESNLPDPKERIDELKMITAAEMLEYQQKLEEAAKVYEQILARRPEAPTNYVNLALVYARLNHFEQAIEVLEKGAEKLPSSLLLLSRLGHTYLVVGRLKKSPGNVAKGISP